MHCHGGAGGEFGADPDAGARRRRAHHHRNGTTTLLGSLVSGAGAALLDGVRTPAPRSSPPATLAGIHLEGPFLSTARCGAQDPAALTDADPSLLERC